MTTYFIQRFLNHPGPLQSFSQEKLRLAHKILVVDFESLRQNKPNYNVEFHFGQMGVFMIILDVNLAANRVAIIVNRHNIRGRFQQKFDLSQWKEVLSNIFFQNWKDDRLNTASDMTPMDYLCLYFIPPIPSYGIYKYRWFGMPLIV